MMTKLAVLALAMGIFGISLSAVWMSRPFVSSRDWEHSAVACLSDGDVWEGDLIVPSSMMAGDCHDEPDTRWNRLRLRLKGEEVFLIGKSLVSVRGRGGVVLMQFPKQEKP